MKEETRAKLETVIEGLRCCIQATPCSMCHYGEEGEDNECLKSRMADLQSALAELDAEEKQRQIAFSPAMRELAEKVLDGAKHCVEPGGCDECPYDGYCNGDNDSNMKEKNLITVLSSVLEACPSGKQEQKIGLVITPEADGQAVGAGSEEERTEAQREAALRKKVIEAFGEIAVILDASSILKEASYFFRTNLDERTPGEIGKILGKTKIVFDDLTALFGEPSEWIELLLDMRELAIREQELKRGQNQ